jgi:hypothetical protein
LAVAAPVVSELVEEELHVCADAGESNGELGIIPRLVSGLFQRIDASPEERRCTCMTCSYMEIYNEQLYDLLEPYKQHLETEAQRRDLRKKRARLRIREDSRGCTHVRELRAVQVGFSSGLQMNEETLWLRELPLISCNWQGACITKMHTAKMHTVGPVIIQTSASYFWGKQIHQTLARVPKKYLKRANI